MLVSMLLPYSRYNTMRLVLADMNLMIALQIQKTLRMYTVQEREEMQKLNQFKQLHPRY